MKWCQKVICNDTKDKACDVIEDYARQCKAHNVCLDWHTELCPAKTCPPEQEYKICGSNCEDTCDSVRNGRKECVEMPVEGCFCLPGKVKSNGTCVTPRECLICDDEGHHDGESWKVDECKSCSCNGTKLQCTETICDDVKVECADNEMLHRIPPAEGKCCPSDKCCKFNFIFLPK